MTIQLTNEVLHKKAKKVAGLEGLVELKEAMTALMRAEGGIGLAAPQIGDSRCLFIMEFNGVVTMYVNPSIKMKVGPEVVGLEGCLSYPDQEVPVKRCQNIWVSYYTEYGVHQIKFLEELEAICFQHELDHLKGKTIV